MNTPKIINNISLEEIYRQQYSHMGRMNNLLYQFPITFSTIIGALWYFSFSFRKESPDVAILVLVFALAVAVTAILIVERFRLAFNAYLNNLNNMDGEYKVTLSHSQLPSVISLIQALLSVSALISTIGIYLVLNG